MDAMMWIMVAVVGVMIFFSFRSNKKQERAQQEMRNNLSVGDEITTIGGIIGKIVSIKDETMVIETTRDHTRIRLLISAVKSVDVPANVRILTPEQAEAEAAKKAEDEKLAEEAKKVAPAPLKKDDKKSKKIKKNADADSAENKD